MFGTRVYAGGVARIPTLGIKQERQRGAHAGRVTCTCSVAPSWSTFGGSLQAIRHRVTHCGPDTRAIPMTRDMQAESVG